MDHMLITEPGQEDSLPKGFQPDGVKDLPAP
jgi:hypothetical protein